MPSSGIRVRNAPATVLFVDPDPDLLSAYQTNATNEGFAVALARDGHEALGMASIILPSVIVLETRLPHSDGFDLIERLRAGVRTKAIPVVIVSGEAGAEFEARVTASGCRGYLTKPCAIDGLLRVVRILAMSRAPEDAREW